MNIIKELLCDEFSEKFIIHLRTCAECKSKIAVVLNMIEESSIIKMLLSSHLKGKSLKQFIEETLNKEKE